MQETKDNSSKRKAEAEAEQVIKKYVWGTAGVGLLPLPFIDLAGIVALQLKLVHSLAGLYGVEFSAHRVKALVAALIGGGSTMMCSRNLASALKLLPFGAYLGFLSTSGLGAATTYAVGKVFVLHFEAGGTLLDFDPKAMQEYYAAQLAAGQSSGTRKSFVGVKP